MTVVDAPPAPARARARAQLQIEGMTCASCAARVERRLNRLAGVEASVSYATDEAAIAYDPDRIDVAGLIAAVESTGYHATRPAEERRAGDPLADLRRRLLVAVALSAPLVAIAMLPTLHFTDWEWLALALSTPVVFWAGAGFHRAALLNLRHRAATMDTLVSLGTLAAFGWSTIALVLAPGSPTYFEVAAVITTLILLGRLLESRARRRAGDALRALAQLGASEARVLRDGEEVLVPVGSLEPGDLFVVRPGEKVATDGIVVEGSAAIDASMLTGEAVPVEVGPGSAVAGATIDTSGRLLVRATQVGSQTMLAQIARLVSEAQAGKAPVQRLVDRVASVFVPIVLALSLLTLAGWLVATHDAQAAFGAAVAVLIIACPCALGLATPTALVVGTGRAAQLGILIRGPEVLERTRRITTVVLDKTGTLTTGTMRLAAVIPAAGSTADELLRLAGAAEDGSEHPLAGAIARGARERIGPLPTATDFTTRAGLGIEARVQGRAVVAGRPSFLAERGIELGSVLERAADDERRVGRSVVAVAVDGAAHGLLSLSDELGPTSAAAVARLRELGMTPLLLTGDNEAAARSVAASVGIELVRSEVLPADKAAEIARLQSRGEAVAMVGDGVNDAPALARADLGIAIGTGTDVAAEASDLTLVSGDLRGVADAIRLSRRTLRTIEVNLFWAFAYNVAAIPLAMAGLLDPMVASAAMACSSVFVVANSLRLRRFRSDREQAAMP